MAVLGAQMVITLIMISIIQKVNPHFSFAKWFLCSTGLYRYLHPTDDVLRLKAGIPKEKPIKNQHKYNKYQQNGFVGNHQLSTTSNPTSNQFHIPRNLDVELEKVPIINRDIIHLRYFTEYQWLLDFSIYAAIVYTISEVYHYYFPLKNEVNLSMVWCILVIFFSLKLLSSLTVLYFHGEDSIGERSMVIVAYLVYLLIAMIVLIIDESILETGLDDAYKSFNDSAAKFLQQQGLQSTGPASKLIIKLIMAFGCGILGSLYTFPGLRMAKMHWDSLRHCRDSKLKQLLLNTSFILPFILVILWIRPVSRDYLTVRIFEGMDKPILKPHVFETLRLLLVVFVVILRFALMPIYLQAYLNIAYDRIIDLRKEAGRITNVDFQKKISSIFYYLCVVTLQFAAPLILCLYLTLMYKSLGGFSWTGHHHYHHPVPLQKDFYDENNSQSLRSANHVLPFTATTEPLIDHSGHFNGRDVGMEQDFNILESAQNLQLSLISLKNVFTTEVYKGFLGFATWWSYFTLFATTSLGILYQSYFNKT